MAARHPIQPLPLAPLPRRRLPAGDADPPAVRHDPVRERGAAHRSGPVPYEFIERATQDVLEAIRSEQARLRLKVPLSATAQKLYNWLNRQTLWEANLTLDEDQLRRLNAVLEPSRSSRMSATRRSGASSRSTSKTPTSSGSSPTSTPSSARMRSTSKAMSTSRRPRPSRKRTCASSASSALSPRADQAFVLCSR